MMMRETIPMFLPDERLIQLGDVLALCSGDDLEWSILAYEGIGNAPRNLSMQEFEEQIHVSSAGYMMSWDDLLEFAARLEQTFNCLLVGVLPHARFEKAALIRDNCTGCEIVIEAFDSSEWSVRSGETIGLKGLLSKD